MGDKPKPTDDPRTAQRKSRSTEERIEEPAPESEGTITSPAPGGHVPVWGARMPGPLHDEPDEAREALANERKRTEPPGS